MTQQLTPKTAKQILDDLNAGKCTRAQAEAAAERRGILAEYRAEYKAYGEMIRKQIADDNSDLAVYYRDLDKIERALNM